MANRGWEDAGLLTNALQIEGIVITPDPPRPGDTVKVTIKATVKEEIKEGAYLDFTVKLGLIKIISKQYDLFKELRDEGSLKLTLDTNRGDGPIKTGNVVLSFTVNIPQETPRAKFMLLIRGYTAEEDDLVDLKLKFDFVEAQA